MASKLIAVVLGVLAGTAELLHLGGVVNAQTYDAEVEDIWLDPSTIYRGTSATVYARFHNLESEGGFDVRIVIDPPTGDDDSDYVENLAIGSDQKKEHSVAYLFD